VAGQFKSVSNVFLEGKKTNIFISNILRRKDAAECGRSVGRTKSGTESARVLDGFGEVCREQTLLSGGVLGSAQPALLLLFRIVVLNNVNELTDLEGEFIHILGLIFISSFHFVEDTWGQIVRGGA